MKNFKMKSSKWRIPNEEFKTLYLELDIESYILQVDFLSKNKYTQKS